jgi:hypothetical protein
MVGMAKDTLLNLRARGFDLSYHIPFTREYKVKCSQCEAVAINGIACHEQGCPNQTYECRGCGNRVTRHQRYCEECS